MHTYKMQQETKARKKNNNKTLQGPFLTCGRFLHLLPLPLLLLSLKNIQGTHKVWLQHSRSLDHSDILLLTAMFTHPLLDIQTSIPQTPGSTTKMLRGTQH